MYKNYFIFIFKIWKEIKFEFIKKDTLVFKEGD